MIPLLTQFAGLAVVTAIHCTFNLGTCECWLGCAVPDAIPYTHQRQLAGITGSVVAPTETQRLGQAVLAVLRCQQLCQQALAMHVDHAEPGVQTGV